MSSPLFKTDIKFIQRMLSCAGLYKYEIDGDFGPKTQAAEDDFDTITAELIKKYGAFDPRTEGVITTLLPKAQEAARQFMIIAKSAPFQVKFLSGTRTYAEQNVLYAQGRTAKGKIVTNAKGGQSNHNFCIAWDVGIFVNSQYYTGETRIQEKAYDDLAKIVLPTLELDWGGQWKSITDKPHYGLLTNKSISQVRALFEAGKPYV